MAKAISYTRFSSAHQSKGSTVVRVIAAVAVVCVLAEGLSRWNSGRVKTVESQQLYRSGQLSPGGLEQAVADYGIKTVINLRGSSEGEDWYEQEKAISEQLGISHHDIALSESKFPLYHRMKYLLDLYDNAERPILVHCRRGVDRAGFASAVYVLSQQQQASLDDALEHVSWKYLYLFPNKIREVVYGYRDWLGDTTNNSIDTFKQWFQTVYEDEEHNIQYRVDALTRVNKKKRSYLLLHGWIYDPTNQGNIQELHARIDGKTLAVVRNKPRPDVERYFKSETAARTGWVVKLDINQWQQACYNVELIVNNSSPEPLVLNVPYPLCQS